MARMVLLLTSHNGSFISVTACVYSARRWCLHARSYAVDAATILYAYYLVMGVDVDEDPFPFPL